MVLINSVETCIIRVFSFEYLWALNNVHVVAHKRLQGCCFILWNVYDGNIEARGEINKVFSWEYNFLWCYISRLWQLKCVTLTKLSIVSLTLYRHIELAKGRNKNLNAFLQCYRILSPKRQQQMIISSLSPIRLMKYRYSDVYESDFT